MRRVVAGFALALAGFGAHPIVAHAAGRANLGWGDCAPAGPGTLLRESTCALNTGSETLVASFVPPDTLPALAQLEWEIDLSISAAALTPWFHYEATGCRAGSLVVTADFSGLALSCADPWLGAAVATYSYVASIPENLNLGRLHVTVALPPGSPVQVEPGHEYDAFAVTFDFRRTNGPDRCPSCLDDGCIQVRSLTLVPAIGPSSTVSYGPQSAVEWQGATFPCPSALPTHRSSWGQLKSLYR